MRCSETWRWRAHVRSQVRSGLSQAVYCRIYGISGRELAQWRHRAWTLRLRPLSLVAIQRRDG